MSENDLKFEGLSEILKEKLIQVSRLKHDTRAFVLEPHVLKDTIERTKEVVTLGGELHEYLVVIHDREEQHPNDSAKIATTMDLWDRVEKGYDDIRDTLSQDRDEKLQEQKDKRVDLIKNITFLLGVPGVFVTGVKNGIGHGHIDPDDAMYIGFAISIPTVFHKTIRSAFSKAAKMACKAPAAISAIPAAIINDMRVVYVREMIKDAKNKAQLCFATAAKSINDNNEGGRRSIIRRVLGKRDPKP